VLAQALVVMGRLRFEKGNVDSSLSFFDRASDLIVKHNLQQHAVNAEYLYFMGMVETVRGTHAQVLQNFEQSLTVQHNATGKEHIQYVRILTQLVRALALQGAFERALQKVEEASLILQSIIEQFNPNHPVIANVLFAKACVFHQMNRRIEAVSALTIAAALCQACYGNDDQHISLLDIYPLLGILSMESGDFKTSIGLIGKAQMIHSRYFLTSDNSQEVNQLLHVSARLSYLQLLVSWKRGVFDDYDLTVFENKLQECVKLLARSFSLWKGDNASAQSCGGSLLLGDILLSLARVQLFNGKFQEARSLIGQSGTQIKNYFQNYDSHLLYSSLMVMGELFMEQDKHKDAKVIFSYCMLNVQLLLGPKLSNHMALIDILFLSVENMRRLGYFHDAVESLDVLTDKIQKTFGVDSFEMRRLRFLDACILRDRQKFTKSELAFTEVEKGWVESFSAVSLNYFFYLKEYGKCFMMQNKLTLASNCLSSALEMSSRFKLTWAKVPCLMDLTADFQLLQMSNRPNEQQTALKVLKETLLHDATVVFGANHMFTMHIKGRVALLANSIQKGSGRKAIFEILKAFDEMKPFPLPYDHPYVQELGGYEKATSKDRLSRNIAEMALYSWAEISAEAFYDPNDQAQLNKYSPLVPKSVFVDMKNNDPLQWGLVHYYGHDIDTANKRGRSRVILQRGDRSRSPSPTGSALNGKPTSEKVGKVGPTLAEIQEKLKQETTARKTAEDTVVQLRHDKHNIEENLDSEKLKSAQLTNELAAENELKKSFENQVDELTKQMKELHSKFLIIEEQLAEKVRKEEEVAAKRKFEQDLADAEAKLRAERLAKGDGDDTSNFNDTVTVALTPDQVKELEAAEFLLLRGIRLYEEGFYRKAQPLFDESRVVRETILGLRKMPTLEVLRWQAVNQCSIGNCFVAEELFSLCLSTLHVTFGRDNEAYSVTKLEALSNAIELGNFSVVREELDPLSKSIALKVQELDHQMKQWNVVLTTATTHQNARLNIDQSDDDEHDSKTNEGKKSNKVPPSAEQILEATNELSSLSAQLRSTNTVFGRILTLQAQLALEEGKFNEAKAHAERGQALLSKSVGLNDWLMAKLLLVKARIFVVLERPKEAIAMIEQATMAVVVVLRSREPSSSEDAATVSSSTESKKGIDAYEHPLLADIFVVFAKAMLIQCQYTDAKKKLIRARIIRTKYFEFPELSYRDIRLLELDVIDGTIASVTCDFFPARDTMCKVGKELMDTLAVCFHYSSVALSKHTLMLQIYQQSIMIDIRLGDFVSAKDYISLLTKQLKLLDLPDSIFSFDVILWQVEIMHMTGDFFTSRDIIENTMEKLKSATSKEHPLLLHFVLKQAEYYDHNNEIDVAEKFYERVVKYLRMQFPNGHVLCLEALRLMVLLHLRKGQPLLARKALKELDFAAHALFAFANTHAVFAEIIVLDAQIAVFELENPDASIVEISEEVAQGFESINTEEINQPTKEEPQLSSQKEQQDILLRDNIEMSFELEVTVDSLPVFNNQSFIAIAEKYEIALEKLSFIFSVNDQFAAHDKRDVGIAFGPPMVTYLSGLLGQIHLKEFIALQRYIQNLSMSQREQYFLQQQEKEKSLTKRKAITTKSDTTPEPTGKREIEIAIQRLTDWDCFQADHAYIVELKEILQDLVLQFDDLQIAQMHFQRANQLKSNGNFSYADKLYDEAFILLFKTLGGHSAMSSLFMTQLLFEKGENSRHLARKPDYVKSLHILSIRIYKRHKGDENKFDSFVAKNLLAMMILLLDQHQYEEGLAMFQSLQSSLLRSYPLFESVVNNAHNSKDLSNLQQFLVDKDHDVKDAFLLLITLEFLQAKCLIQMYKYDDALLCDQRAMDMIKILSVSLVTGVSDVGCDEATNPLLAEALIRIYVNELAIHDMLGNFAKSEEMVEHIQLLLETWKKQHLLLNSQKVESKATRAQSKLSSINLSKKGASSPKKTRAKSLKISRPESRTSKNEYKSNGGNAVIASMSDVDLGDSSARLRIVQAEVCIAIADHALILSRFSEAKLWTEKAFELQLKLFNRVKAKLPTATTLNKTQKKNVDLNEEPDWTKEKQEEVRSSFLNAMDIMVLGGMDENAGKNDNDNLETAEGNDAIRKTTTNPRVVRADVDKPSNRQAEELDAEIELMNDEVSKDFESTQISLAHSSNVDGVDKGKGNDDDISTKKSQMSIGVTLMDFMLEDEKLFVFRDQKLTAHVALVETLFMLSRIALFLGDLSFTKESLEISQQSINALYARPTFFKHKLTFIRAKLRWLQNQLEDSKVMYLKLLEQRLSLAASTISVNLDIAESYTALAQVHIALGQFDDAMQYINDAIKIERKLFHRYTTDRTLAINGALATSATTSFRGATGSSAQSSKEKDSHYRIQSLLVVCANILSQKGFFQDSQMLLDSCLATQKYNLSALNTHMHLSIVDVMIVKARNHLSLGQCDDALTNFQLAKSMYFAMFGEKHYEVGLLYLYTAQTMRCMGRLLECKQQLDLAITTIRCQLGKYHFHTILTLLEIGINFMDLGKYITSQHVLERAVYLLKKSLGKDHLSVATGYNALAELQLSIGLFDKVGKYLEDSLYITRKVIGSDRYPLVALVMSNVNEMKAAKAIFDESIQGFDDTIALLKLIYNGPNHFQIAKVLLVLAKTFLQQGKVYEAKAHYDKAYLMVKVLSPSADHVLLYESQLGVAQCLLRIGRIDQAKAVLERCLVSMKDWKGSSHPVIATILNLLGDVYNLLQRLPTAETLLIEAYTIRIRSLRECNECHPDIVQSWLSLAENLRLRGLFVSSKVNNNESESEYEKDRLLISDTMKLNIAKDAGSTKTGRQSSITEGLNEDGLEDDKEELDDVAAILSQMDKEDPDLAEPKKTQVSSKLVIDTDSISTNEAPIVERMLEPSTVSETALGEHGMTVSASILPGGPSHTLSHFQESKNGDDNCQAQCTQRDIDEESAPTVMISAIEKLDRDDFQKKPSNGNAIQDGEEDGASLPGGIVSEIQRFIQNETEYRAMPLLEKSLTSLLICFNDDQMHPMVFSTRHLIAETVRGLGDFEKAMNMHEQLFTMRRKILGDQHIDTITSLMSIADLLRVMKRVFSASSSKPMHSSAHGTATGGNSNSVGNGGVSLLDHLTSLLAPARAPPRVKSAVNNVDDDDEDNELFGDTEEEKLRRLRKKAYDQGKNWIFLTKSDFNKDTSGKKPKPLPKPRGYMGYAFPPTKKDSIDESTGSMLQAINNSTNATNSTSPLQDAKKCTDLAVNLLKKLLASEEFGITLKKNDLFDHPFVASALYNKAEICRLRGEGLQALRFLEQSLAMRRRLFRAHHPAVAECLFSMAELLRADQRYAQALPIFDKSLEIRLEVYGTTHFSIAEVENSIALVHIALGDFPRAQEVLLHALDLCELTLGPHHPSTAFACSNNASLLQAMGKFKEALAWYRKALQIKVIVFGEKHPEIAASFNNMGLLYKSQGQIEEALSCYEKALTIQKQTLGTNHPDIASTYNNFAALLAVQEGRKYEAKEYFKQSLAIRTACFGNENALVAATMNNFAGLLYTLGETTIAHEMFEETLRIRRMVLGEDHPAVAESLHNLGYFYLSQQQYYEARLAYEEAMKIRKKIFGHDHLIVATTALHLSNAMVQMKDYQSAVEFAREAYEIRELALGDLHADTIASKKSMDRIEKKFQKNEKKLQSGNPVQTLSSAGQRPKAAKDLPPRQSQGALGLGEENMD
jgi:tetratricopeptide (TPR) repeat protein